MNALGGIVVVMAGELWCGWDVTRVRGDYDLYRESG